jgi:hypothetical protein
MYSKTWRLSSAQLLRNEIKTEKKVRRKIIGEKETHIEEAMKILEEEKDEIQAVLASNKKGIIFSTASELGSNLPELSFYSLPMTCSFQSSFSSVSSYSESHTV